MGPLDLVNKNPFGFHETKATCLIRSLPGAFRPSVDTTP